MDRNNKIVYTKKSSLDSSSAAFKPGFRSVRDKVHGSDSGLSGIDEGISHEELLSASPHYLRRRGFRESVSPLKYSSLPRDRRSFSLELLSEDFSSSLSLMDKNSPSPLYRRCLIHNSSKHPRKAFSSEDNVIISKSCSIPVQLMECPSLPSSLFRSTTSSLNKQTKKWTETDKKRSSITTMPSSPFYRQKTESLSSSSSSRDSPTSLHSRKPSCKKPSKPPRFVSMEIWEIQKKLKRGEMVQGILQLGSSSRKDLCICAPAVLGRSDGHVTWRYM